MYTHLIAKIKPADGYRVMSLMESQQNIFSDMNYALFNYSFRDCFSFYFEPTIVRGQEPAIEIACRNGEIENQGFLLGDAVYNLVTCDRSRVNVIPKQPLTSGLSLQQIVDECSGASSLGHHQSLLMSVQRNEHALESRYQNDMSSFQKEFHAELNIL